MKKYLIGLVDYGMGNHASVVHSLKDIGCDVRIGSSPSDLDAADVLVLPGVGAFPAAMDIMQDRGLVSYLQKQAQLRRPIIGICLGMQLLVESSYEHGHTPGLKLIPGEISPFPGGQGHIGWNTLNVTENHPLWLSSNNESFYFNHSYCYQGAANYQMAISQHLLPFASVIQNGNVVGLQFHPEKSQLAGKILLKNLIKGLVGA